MGGGIGGDDDDDDGGGADAGATDETMRGCGDTTLLATPEDPRSGGPWAVGAQTVMVDGLRTEVWYPAAPGSEVGMSAIEYDLREHLPPDEAAKIPDEENPPQPCDCYRDLPLDDRFGPYPVIVFVHGTAGFRTQTLTQMTHWASRGFVVVASDHPGITLADALDFQFGGDQAGDAARVLAQLASPSNDLAFLAGHIDVSLVGMAGHSAGGGAISTFGDGDDVRVLVPMASGGTSAGSSLVSTLVLGGMDDGVSPYSNQQQGYAMSPRAKRLVGLTGAGHLAFSDLCFIGRDRGGLLQVALDNGVDVNPLIASLARDGCEPGQLEAERGWAIVDYATAAVFEETLHCNDAMGDRIAQIESAFSEVGEYREEL